jgi:adenylosuccinate lyase
MRKTALKAAADQKTLKEVFIKENEKQHFLTDEEIKQALDPENYLGATDEIIARVIQKLDR